MQEIGKVLFGVGVIFTIVGLLLWKLGGRLPLGRLPGDIAIQRPNFSFYFPLTTCVLISIVLTLLFWLFRR